MYRVNGELYMACDIMNYIETCTKRVPLWRYSNLSTSKSVLHVRPGWIIYQNMRETFKVMKFVRESPISRCTQSTMLGGAIKAPPPMGLLKYKIKQL